MDEKELYKEYEGLCIPEEDYDMLIQNNYIIDLRDFFVGEYFPLNDVFEVAAIRGLKNMLDYMHDNDVIFLHSLGEDGLAGESRGYFFYENHLIIVPIAAPVFGMCAGRRHPGNIHKKSTKKPVFIPLSNIVDYSVSGHENDCTLELIYKNGLTEELKFSKDITTYSDDINSETTYKSLASEIINKSFTTFSFDILEDFVSFCFNDIPEDTFRILKYSTIRYTDFSLIDKILELKDKIDVKRGKALIDNFLPYEEKKNEYNRVCKECDALNKEIETANFLKKSILKNKKEKLEKEKRILSLDYRRTAISELCELEDTIRKLSKDR